MGSVADLYTTGDNDPEIEPVQYYRHYLYCDACGSFELDPWLMPDNHEKIETARRWLRTAGLIALPLVALVAFLVNSFFFPALFIPAWLMLVAGSIFAVSMFTIRWILGSRIELLGMRCRQCEATYAHRTPFFTDLDANPCNLTVADVPRPLGVSPFVRGEFVDSE